MDHQLTSWSHTVSLPADPASAARARDFVCAHLLVHGLPTLVDDLRLVTSELTTNAMEHAQTPFDLTLAREGPSVVLSVEDGSTRLPRPADTDTVEPRGRGLAIVSRLSSGWGVDVGARATKVIWARFDAAPATAPAASPATARGD